MSRNVRAARMSPQTCDEWDQSHRKERSETDRKSCARLLPPRNPQQQCGGRSDDYASRKRVEEPEGRELRNGVQVECGHHQLSLLLSSNWRKRANSWASMLFSSRMLRTSNSSEFPKNRLTR